MVTAAAVWNPDTAPRERVKQGVAQAKALQGRTNSWAHQIHHLANLQKADAQRENAGEEG